MILISRLVPKPNIRNSIAFMFSYSKKHPIQNTKSYLPIATLNTYLHKSYIHKRISLNRFNMLKFCFSTQKLHLDEPFETNIKFKSEEANQLYLEADHQYYWKDNSEEAIKTLEKAITIENQNPDFLYKISHVFANQGLMQRYVTILERILKLTQDKTKTTHIKKILWSVFMIRKKQKQALKIQKQLNDQSSQKWFKKQRPALMLESQDPILFQCKLQSKRGQHFQRMMSNKKAIKHYRFVLQNIDKVKSNNKQCLIPFLQNLSQLYMKEGNFQESIKSFQKIKQILLQSNNQKLIIMYDGFIEHCKNNHQQAVLKLQKSIESGIQTKYLRIKLLQSLMNLGKWEQAVKQSNKYLQKYKEIDTQAIQVNHILIYAYTHLQKYEQALEAVEKIKSHIDIKQYSSFAAQIHKKLNNYDKTIHHLNVFLQNQLTQQQQKQALEKRGLCYYVAKKYQLAIADFTKVIQNYKDTEQLDEVYRFRASCYYSLQKYNQTLLDLEKVQKVDGGIFNLQAKSYRHLGKKDQAIRKYRQLIEYTKNHGEKVPDEYLKSIEQYINGK